MLVIRQVNAVTADVELTLAAAAHKLSCCMQDLLLDILGTRLAVSHFLWIAIIWPPLQESRKSLGLIFDQNVI